MMDAITFEMMTGAVAVGVMLGLGMFAVFVFWLACCWWTFIGAWRRFGNWGLLLFLYPALIFLSATFILLPFLVVGIFQFQLKSKQVAEV